MAFLQKRLAGPLTLGNIATMNTVPGSALYTPATGVTTIIKQVMLSNITSSTQQVSLWVYDGSTPVGDNHIVFHSLDLAAYETMLVNLSLVVDNAGGDAIYAGAGNASSVNLTISGIEET